MIDADRPHPESVYAIAHRMELFCIAITESDRRYKTRKDIAMALGIKPQMLSFYTSETSPITVPPEVVRQMLRVFHVDANYIYHGDMRSLPHGIALEIGLAAEVYANRKGKRPHRHI